ncbi:MAG: NAD-dependent epimerase/dehydratase family protein [Nitrospirae bacterium]|nr:NAD-dependent epimerase/dehydratase family protein [Nitrospirota bacterium]
MRILITGSEGSLAQIVIPYLQNDGHEIIGVDNFARYGHIERKRTYEFMAGDLGDTAVVRSVFSQYAFDAVFHFAALIYGVVGFHKRPADIIADNNLMTINLLKYGREKIKRFIYLSSSMVYERSMKWPHKEEDTEDITVMSTSYGLSKYIGERVVQSFHEQYGIDYVIWRPFNIITPFEAPEEEGFSHVFADMIDKILVQKQQPVNIFGDGEQIRCFTNIYDVGDSLATFSLRDEATNQIFNIGNSEPTTIKELAARIVSIGKRHGLLPDDYCLTFKHQPIYADDVKKRIPDVSKIRNVFGWKAGLMIDGSLEQYIRHKFNK